MQSKRKEKIQQGERTVLILSTTFDVARVTLRTLHPRATPSASACPSPPTLFTTAVLVRRIPNFWLWLKAIRLIIDGMSPEVDLLEGGDEDIADQLPKYQMIKKKEVE